jgi:hypothetical protein
MWNHVMYGIMSWMESCHGWNNSKLFSITAVNISLAYCDACAQAQCGTRSSNACLGGAQTTKMASGASEKLEA